MIKETMLEKLERANKLKKEVGRLYHEIEIRKEINDYIIDKDESYEDKPVFDSTIGVIFSMCLVTFSVTFVSIYMVEKPMDRQLLLMLISAIIGFITFIIGLFK